MANNSLPTVQRDIAVKSGNIASSGVVGAKRKDVQFSTMITGGGLNASYGGSIIAHQRSNINHQGEFESTGIATDFAINGEAMAVVKTRPNDPKSEFLYTRACSFRQDENGELVNAAGYRLMAWELDTSGNLPRENGLLSSLKSVSFKNASAEARATSRINIGLNLDAEKKSLKGAGEVARLSTSAANRGTGIYDIIIPEDQAFGSIRQGDKIKLTSTPPSTEREFIFGGIAISKQITSAPGIYGVTRPETQFNFGAGANLITEGWTLDVTVDGRRTTLTAVANANANKNQFNSLNSLMSQIKKIDGLTARIVDGRLFITSTDGNKEITFANGNGSNLKEKLGLVNVAAANPNERRFATLNALKNHIAASGDVGLAAEINAGGVDFHALVATSSLKVEGESFGENDFSSVTIGDGTEKGRATVWIDAPMHGLHQGDFIKIAGSGQAQLPDGIYRVSDVGADQFVVNLIDANPAAFPAAAAAAPFAINANAKWQKVAGVADATIATNNIGTAAGNNVLIDLGGGNMLAQNDVVYISGFGQQVVGGQNPIVPDGYYIVQATANGGQHIEITPSGGVAGVVALGARGFNINVTKVGVSNAGAFINGLNFDTPLITTGAGVGSKTVRVNMAPGHNYSINDYFSISMTPANVVVDGLTIRKDTAYKVTAVGANFIEFEVGDTDGTTVGGGVVGNYTGAAGATALAQDFRINHFGQMFKELGLQQDKELFDPTYDPNNPDLSLASGKLPAGDVFSAPITVYDSLGISHDLFLSFAKMEKNRWAVELHAKKNDDDSFDAISDQNDWDGKIIADFIEFDGDGSLLSAGGLIAPIQVNWKSGADSSQITLDWGAIAGLGLDGKPTKDGIRQVSSPNDVRYLDQDGSSAGLLKSISIDEDGFISGSFSNGVVRKLFKIPMATFANINGLEELSGNVYRTTLQSGAVNLKEAGRKGAATVISQAVEGSNIDAATETIELNNTAQIHHYIARTTGVQSNAQKTLLDELR